MLCFLSAAKDLIRSLCGVVTECEGRRYVRESLYSFIQSVGHVDMLSKYRSVS